MRSDSDRWSTSIGIRAGPGSAAIIESVHQPRTGAARLAVMCVVVLPLAACGSSGPKMPAGKTVTITSANGHKRTCIDRTIGGIYCPTVEPATATSATPTITSPTGEKRECTRSPGGGLYCPPPAATAFSTPPGLACQTRTVSVVGRGQKKVGKAKQTVPPPPGIDAVTVRRNDVTVSYRWAPEVGRSCRPGFLVIAISSRANPYARRVVTVRSKQAGVVHVRWLFSPTAQPDTANVSGMTGSGAEGRPAKALIRQR